VDALLRSEVWAGLDAPRSLLVAAVRETLVVYESPVRVVGALADIIEVLGDREAFLCREATKVHEEYVRGTLSAIRARLDARGDVKGEVVLVIAGAPEGAAAVTGTVAETFAQLTAEGMTRREAVKETARRHDLPARDVYARVLDDED